MAMIEEGGKMSLHNMEIQARGSLRDRICHEPSQMDQQTGCASRDLCHAQDLRLEAAHLQFQTMGTTTSRRHHFLLHSQWIRCPIKVNTPKSLASNRPLSQAILPTYLTASVNNRLLVSCTKVLSNSNNDKLRLCKCYLRRAPSMLQSLCPPKLLLVCMELL